MVNSAAPRATSEWVRKTGRFVAGLALQPEHGTERERQPADQFQ